MSFSVGRWSQETGSDNEIHPHPANSPGPLPPLLHAGNDLTDTTSYLTRKPPHLSAAPSMHDNIHRNYNIHANVAQTVYDNDRYKYEINYDNIYSQNKDYQANYSGSTMGGDGILASPYNPNSNCPQSPDVHYTGATSDAEYSDNQMITQMVPQSNLYLYDKKKMPYMGSKSELPYMSRDRLTNAMCSPSPRETHYGLKSPGMYSGAESVQSVHSMLKNEYQVRRWFAFKRFASKLNDQIFFVFFL